MSADAHSFDDPRDQEVAALTRNRAALDQQGWARLYALIHSILVGYRPGELASLPQDDSLSLIDDFFRDKLFMRAGTGDCWWHTGAVKDYFRNYLRDRIRSNKVKSSKEDVFADETSIAQVPDEALDFDLAEHGWTPGELAEAARSFLDAQETWVLVMLGLHYCANCQPTPTMCELARKHGIASYAYKAEKLGFNWREVWAGKGRRWDRDTLIGRWVSETLAIACTQDNDELLLAVFDVLCEQARRKIRELSDEGAPT